MENWPIHFHSILLGSSKWISEAKSYVLPQKYWF